MSGKLLVKNQCPALSENNPVLSQPEFFGAELLRQVATKTCPAPSDDDADHAVMEQSDSPPPKPPRLVHRDQENDIRLYHGDCLDLLDAIAAQYPDGCFDMVFADPPYFLSNNGSTCRGGERVPVNKGQWDKSRGLRDDLKFTLAWLRRCRRVLLPSGTIWISGTHHSIHLVGYLLQRLKFRILNDITWKKLNPAAKSGLSPVYAFDRNAYLGRSRRRRGPYLQLRSDAPHQSRLADAVRLANECADTG